MSSSANIPMKLIEVRTDTEAAIIVAALEREGIEAHISGEYTSGFRAEAPGWPTIVVRNTDFEHSQELLTKIKLPSDSTSNVSAENEDSHLNGLWTGLEIIAFIGTLGGIIYALISSI
ncbi:putative signal transducing protein [Bythopirellula goksoeyrii]|uniref:DUF2007 domain-containing protein n=1 Tax=Bythopirellula goksoeyrii TaxID=1400387 RepID=A0A5B9QBT5_9BACT|nr:DUF2007 domain-containing protein [Bythopirellula goksoeyrii]QEG34376.1 hypothetical protein Pr1d_16520 [Bythopirellula goksoeyrii]